MSGDKILLVAGDAGFGRQLDQLLHDHGVATAYVDDQRAGASPEALFDVAFDAGATVVVLVESLHRYPAAAQVSDDAWLRAALRAARSPLVTGFGWVTARDDTHALDELRKQGKPFGILRLGPLIEIGLDAQEGTKPGKPVVIDANAARRAAQAGAVVLSDATRAVAAWIERDGTRGGGLEKLRGGEQPLQRAVQELGFEPLVLASWRAGLNRALGMRALDGDGDALHVRRRSWLHKSSDSPASPVARVAS